MQKILLFLTATSVLAMAAEPASRLSSPVLGYVFDNSAKALRPISGIPGAAELSAAIPSASKLQIGFVSQNREWLLAVLLEGGAEIVNLRLGGSKPLEGAPQDVALAAWSSDSNSLALWSKSGILQVWSGVSETPALNWSQPAEAAFGIALADGGASALLWSNSGLFAADSKGLRQLISEPVQAAAYRATTADWAAIAGNQLVRPGQEAQALSVENATSVAYTDNSILVGGKGGVEAIADSGSSLTSCDCDVTVLEPLSGTAVFRLTASDTKWLALYDGSESEPRILYIPGTGERQ